MQQPTSVVNLEFTGNRYEVCSRDVARSLNSRYSKALVRAFSLRKLLYRGGKANSFNHCCIMAHRKGTSCFNRLYLSIEPFLKLPGISSKFLVHAKVAENFYEVSSISNALQLISLRLGAVNSNGVRQATDILSFVVGIIRKWTFSILRVYTGSF